MTPETGFRSFGNENWEFDDAWRMSTIFRLENQSANIAGAWAAAQIFTQG
jgi:nuclear transport factor 2 (NTF2) superfamily protein